jgi:hypothetical protein
VEALADLGFRELPALPASQVVNKLLKPPAPFVPHAPVIEGIGKTPQKVTEPEFFSTEPVAHTGRRSM